MSLFPHASLVIGLVLALLTAAAFNWSWVAQHTITSRLPRLTVRRPWWSLRVLFGHRRWLVAFLIGVGGWGFYIVAVHLAPLSLVQAVSAGGTLHGYTSSAGAGAQYANYWTPQEVREADADEQAKQQGP